MPGKIKTLALISLNGSSSVRCMYVLWSAAIAGSQVLTAPALMFHPQPPSTPLWPPPPSPPQIVSHTVVVFRNCYIQIKTLRNSYLHITFHMANIQFPSCRHRIVVPYPLPHPLQQKLFRQHSHTIITSTTSSGTDGVQGGTDGWRSHLHCSQCTTVSVGGLVAWFIGRARMDGWICRRELLLATTSWHKDAAKASWPAPVATMTIQVK